MELSVLEKLFQRSSGCRNALAEAPFERVSRNADSRCVCLRLPQFVPESVGNKWYEDALSLMETHGAPISRSIETIASLSSYQYRTARFIRGPCTCSYNYAGTARHVQHQYGFGRSREPTLLSEVEQYLRTDKRILF